MIKYYGQFKIKMTILQGKKQIFAFGKYFFSAL